MCILSSGQQLNGGLDQSRTKEGLLRTFVFLTTPFGSPILAPILSRCSSPSGQPCGKQVKDFRAQQIIAERQLKLFPIEAWNIHVQGARCSICARRWHKQFEDVGSRLSADGLSGKCAPPETWLSGQFRFGWYATTSRWETAHAAEKRWQFQWLGKTEPGHPRLCLPCKVHKVEIRAVRVLFQENRPPFRHGSAPNWTKPSTPWQPGPDPTGLPHNSTDVIGNEEPLKGCYSNSQKSSKGFKLLYTV